jgi:hypothetical protein
MLAKILFVAGLVSAGLLLIILTTTTPSSSGAFGILAVFLLSYIVILSLLTYILWVSSKLIDRVGRGFRLFKKPYSLSFRKSYYYSTIIAVGPVIIVSLQSVGGVGVYEVGLVGLFVILGCIYVSRRVA